MRKSVYEAERYGARHQREKRRVGRLVDLGLAACARCGEPIVPGARWHLDHADDGVGYLGASHATCNLEAAGRNAHKRGGSREW